MAPERSTREDVFAACTDERRWLIRSENSVVNNRRLLLSPAKAVAYAIINPQVSDFRWAHSISRASVMHSDSEWIHTFIIMEIQDGKALNIPSDVRYRFSEFVWRFLIAFQRLPRREDP